MSRVLRSRVLGLRSCNIILDSDKGQKAVLASDTKPEITLSLKSNPFGRSRRYVTFVIIALLAWGAWDSWSVNDDSIPDVIENF